MMFCGFCKVNECAKNKKGELLQFCSKSCQHKFSIEKRKKTNIEKYGTENPMLLASVKEKRKQTNIERFGTENPFSLKHIQEKQQETCEERYGVAFASQNDEIKEKMKLSWSKYTNNHPFSDKEIRQKREQTMLEKYGVRHPILHPEVRAKMESTNLDRYGTINAVLNPIIGTKISDSLRTTQSQEKRIQTTLAKYGVSNANQRKIKKQLEILSDKQWVTVHVIEFGITGLASFLDVSIDTIRKYVKEYNIVIPKQRSDFEREVVAFIKQNYKEQIICNDSSLMGKELDIFLPDRNLAIECNGTYWHSDLNGKNSTYHLNKTLLCESKNVKLLHIWDHDWKYKRSIIESRLRSLLGINNKIHARKCELSDINSKISSQFLKDNHVQGNINSSVRLGLYYNNELVALMTFGKTRYNKEYEWELLRFCNKLNCNVIGGASRLFAAFVNQYSPKNVISYSSKDWNTGSVYKKLGFTFKYSSKPAYYYTNDYKSIENRVRYQKHKLQSLFKEEFDPCISEWDNMKNLGYDRIWDCGNDVWGYTNLN